MLWYVRGYSTLSRIPNGSLDRAAATPPSVTPFHNGLWFIDGRNCSSTNVYICRRTRTNQLFLISCLVSSPAYIIHMLSRRPNILWISCLHQRLKTPQKRHCLYRRQMDTGQPSLLCAPDTNHIYVGSILMMILYRTMLSKIGIGLHLRNGSDVNRIVNIMWNR